MPKHSLPFLASLALLVFLFTGCLLPESKSDRLYLLNAPSCTLEGSRCVVTFADYLCSQELRYSTADGEVHVVPGGLWVQPLDRLFRSALAAQGNSPEAPICRLHIHEIWMTPDGVLQFRAEKRVAGASRTPLAAETPVALPMTPANFQKAVSQGLEKLLQTALKP